MDFWKTWQTLTCHLSFCIASCIGLMVLSLNPVTPGLVIRFDSIESMNADELLVKRKRGKKKFLLGLAFVCAVCFTIGLLIGYFSGRPSDDEDGGGAAPSTGGERYVDLHSFNFIFC